MGPVFPNGRKEFKSSEGQLLLATAATSSWAVQARVAFRSQIDGALNTCEKALRGVMSNIEAAFLQSSRGRRRVIAESWKLDGGSHTGKQHHSDLPVLFLH